RSCAVGASGVKEATGRRPPRAGLGRPRRCSRRTRLDPVLCQNAVHVLVEPFRLVRLPTDAAWRAVMRLSTAGGGRPKAPAGLSYGRGRTKRSDDGRSWLGSTPGGAGLRGLTEVAVVP